MQMFESRTVKLMVAPKGANIFDLGAIFVEIVDEPGGEFIKVSQPNDEPETGTIFVEPDCWLELESTINAMVSNIADVEDTRNGLNDDPKELG